jgi:hypothetical protein
MGSIACPCEGRVEIDPTPHISRKGDIVMEIMKNKLRPEDILFDYTYDQTKIYLIKSNQIEGFFNNKKLIQLPSRGEINFYYNSIILSNFLARRDNILVFLQYTPHLADKKTTGKFDIVSRIYKIEQITVTNISQEKITKQLLEDIR